MINIVFAIPSSKYQSNYMGVYGPPMGTYNVYFNNSFTQVSTLTDACVLGSIASGGMTSNVFNSSGTKYIFQSGTVTVEPGLDGGPYIQFSGKVKKSGGSNENFTGTIGRRITSADPIGQNYTLTYCKLIRTATPNCFDITIFGRHPYTDAEGGVVQLKNVNLGSNTSILGTHSFTSPRSDCTNSNIWFAQSAHTDEAGADYIDNPYGNIKFTFAGLDGSNNPTYTIEISDCHGYYYNSADGGYCFNTKEEYNQYGFTLNQTLRVEAYESNGTTPIPLSYTVSVSSNGSGGSVSGGGTFAAGANVTLNATKNTGYNFTNWTEGGSSIGTNTSLTLSNLSANHTIVGNFIAKTYTAANNINGNGGSNGQYTATYDATTIAINTIPTRTGYTLEGLYQEAGCTHKITDASGNLQANTAYTNSSCQWKNDGNVTLYAKWTASSFHLAWDANGGVLVDNEVYSYAVEGDYPGGEELPDGAPQATREGYQLTGWYDAEHDLTWTDDDWTMPNHDVTYVAQWTANTHNVSWVTDGNALTGTYTNGTTAYGTTIVAPATPTKTATAQYTYTFNGWTPAVAATMPDNDVEYTATWTQTPVNYTLTWTTDGDALTGTYTSGTVAYGTTIVAPANPTKTGYTFAGWDVTPASTMPAANTTYTAQWTANTYTITYRDQDDEAYSGSNLASLPASHTYNAATALVDGVKDGYTFDGWYENAECTGEAVTTIAANSITAGKTLYAKWTATVTTHTITLSNGANGTITVHNEDTDADVVFTENTAAVEDGTTLTITATGNTGYGLATLTVNGVAFTSGSTLNLTEDITIAATFTEVVTLLDNKNNTHYNTFKTTYHDKTVTAIYNRQFTEGRWSTLCLPFDVNKNMFSSLNFGSRIYEFKYAEGNANDNSGVNLYFSIAKSIKAGRGYIVNADNALSQRNEFVFPGVTINLSADKGDTLGSVTAYNALDGSGATQGNIELVGTLRKGTLAVQEGEKVNTYMGLKGNKIYYPNITTGSTILAYRGIFRSIDREPLNAERIRIIVDGEEKAELEVINGELQDVQETKKFIENGVLYIERNGIIYDATGRKVE